MLVIIFSKIVLAKL